MPPRGQVHEENVTRLNTMKDWDIVKRLLSYTKSHTKQIVIVFSVMIVTVILGVLEPYLLGLAIDIVSGPFEYTTLLYYLALLVIVVTGSNVLSYVQTILLNKIGQGVIFDIREEIFTHLLYHDMAYLNEKPAGALVTRVTNDTNAINEFYTTVIISVFYNLFKIVGIVIAMFILNARLATYIMIVLPFIIAASFAFRILSRKAYRNIRSNMSRVNAFLAEHLSGMKIIQIFNKEAIKRAQFNDRSTSLKQAYYKQVSIFAIFRPVMYMMHMIAIFIVLYFGSQSVIEGALQIGLLFTFYRYVGEFFNPIQQLAEQFNIVQSAFAASERIFGILDTKPNVIDEDGAIELTSMDGAIEFKNVWFAYNEGEWVLKDVSFTVAPKESVAFVGATGAGKTTILGLITRYYDIQKGDILIDGISIKKITKKSLRKYIGQMLQDVFMFSGTIRSNITLRNEDITEEDIHQSCEYVNANYFIDKLPLRYDEPVRERGNNFSSGQRQLLSFARTIVHKPSVMILDEATSNIDTETEQLIQDSLQKMMSIGTMLVVAHRLSTIQNVDNIIVLSKGEIIEQGSHQELLKQRGHYYNLYRLQYEDVHTAESIALEVKEA
jgi:ATP-binding cassette subfamily B protein